MPQKAIIAFGVITVLLLLQSTLQALPSRDVGLDVSSRREMFNVTQVAFYGALVAIDVVWLVLRDDREMRKRALGLFAVLVYFAAIWTMGEYLANTRWIEQGSFTNSWQATPATEFAALAYDVVVEVAAAYVPFLIIPYEVRRFRERRRSASESAAPAPKRAAAGTFA
ncbi:MAG: hypothetical protein ACTSU5_19315 [Promethearchaeota archaeon]